MVSRLERALPTVYIIGRAIKRVVTSEPKITLKPQHLVGPQAEMTTLTKPRNEDGLLYSYLRTQLFNGRWTSVSDGEQVGNCIKPLPLLPITEDEQGSAEGKALRARMEATAALLVQSSKSLLSAAMETGSNLDTQKK